MSPLFNPHQPVSAADIVAAADSASHKVPKKGKNGRPRKKKSTQRRAMEALSPRWQDFEAGRLDVKDLDWEELSRGQLRNKKGTFSGRKPAILPRAWHDELARRAAEHGQDVLTRNLDVALDSLVQLAKSGPARERLGASQYITDRVLGLMTQKTENKTEITVFSEAIEKGDFLVDLGETDEPLQIEQL